MSEERSADAAPGLRQQLRTNGRAIGAIVVVSAGLLGLLLLLHHAGGVPISDLTRDVNAIAGVPLYAGLLSQIGILLWAAAAAICLFSAAVLPKDERRRPLRQFFVASGLLTLLLGLDDAFQLHEALLPTLGVPDAVMYVGIAGRVVFFGIAETALLVGYVGLVVLYLVRFGPFIRATDYVLLWIALLFFGISMALDVLDPSGINPFLWEDGTKLVGIVSWLVYFARTSATSVSHHLAPRGAT